MATKKSKKAAKKVSTRRGQLYSSTASGRKAYEGDGYGAQQKLVYAALIKLEPATSAQIAEAVEKGGKLETRQSVSRVVGFYLTQMKSEGEVSSKPALKPAKAPKATKTAKTSEVTA